MELLFLGTGAGETWPAFFCACKRCADARREGNVMPGTSVLIDNQYLIDAPPGLGLNLALLKAEVRFPFHVFITHSHQDHFAPGELVSSVDEPANKIFLHLNETSRSLLGHYMKFNRFCNFDKHKNWQIETVSPFQPVRIKTGVSFIPIAADHDNTNNEQPLNYVVKVGNKTLLYAGDTGWYSDQTWAEVLKHRFDLVVLECTCMAAETGGRGHLDVAHFLKFIENLKNHGCVQAGAQIIAAHFSLHDFDDAKAALLREKGINLAYRGMRVRC